METDPVTLDPPARGTRMTVSGAVVSEGRPAAVNDITLRQVTDRYAPPEKALVRLAVVDDLLFVTFVTLTETPTATTQTETPGAAYTFDIDSFADAVTLLIRDRDRSAVREKM